MGGILLLAGFEACGVATTMALALRREKLVQIWLGDGEGLKNVVHAGFDAIVSNYKHWYLPQLWETWDYYYGNDLWAWERTVT